MGFIELESKTYLRQLRFDFFVELFFSCHLLGERLRESCHLLCERYTVVLCIHDTDIPSRCQHEGVFLYIREARRIREAFLILVAFTLSPAVVGVGDGLDILVREVPMDAVFHMSHLGRVDEEGLEDS